MLFKKQLLKAIITFTSKLAQSVQNSFPYYLYSMEREPLAYMINLDVSYVKVLKDMLDLTKQIFGLSDESIRLIDELNFERMEDMPFHDVIAYMSQDIRLGDNLLKLIQVRYKFDEIKKYARDRQSYTIHAPAELVLMIVDFFLGYTERLVQSKIPNTIGIDGLKEVYNYLCDVSTRDMEMNAMKHYMDIFEIFEEIEDDFINNNFNFTRYDLRKQQLRIISLCLLIKDSDKQMTACDHLNNLAKEHYSENEFESLLDFVFEAGIIEILFKENFNLKVIYNLKNFFTFVGPIINQPLLKIILSVQVYNEVTDDVEFRSHIYPLIKHVNREVS